MDNRLYAAVLRQDLYAFIQRSFVALNPQTEFSPSAHIELIAAKLAACLRGEIRRLIINIPPRSLKSHCVSVALPAFLLGHLPSASIICASYGQALADKLAYDCRRLMLESFYQEIFPTRLASKRGAVHDFSTTENGSRLATSVEGPMTGRGADFIIIDDPLKPDEALSDICRQKANDWLDHTVMSRLNDKQTGCVIVIMQRLHMDDLTGHLLQQGGWEHLNLPAIAEFDEAIPYDTPYGKRIYQRRMDEVLHPEREPRQILDELRRGMGEYAFAGQYQQRPVPLDGEIVKRSWLRHYEPYELPSKFDEIVQSWDTASKASELANYSVCTTWGLYRNEIYLLDCFRARLDYPELRRAVINQRDKYNAGVVLIEDKASGMQLIQELKQSGFMQIHAIKPEGDKKSRLFAQTNLIEDESVRFPKSASWLPEYLFELISFPMTKYSDQVDSTSQALAWIKNRNWGPGMGIYYYFKEQYEQRNGKT